MTSLRRTALVASFALLAAVAVGACGGDDDGPGNPDSGGGGGDPDGAAPGTPDGAPGTPDGSTAVTVSATVNPETIQIVGKGGADIEVTITVENFVLEDPTGQPNQDGHGHYHIYLDDATGGQYEAVGSDGTETITLGDDETVLPGPHSFRIVLQNNDHSLLEPSVEFVVPFTVQ